MHNGRDIFGLPKKMSHISLEREGDTVRGWVERAGVRFVQVEVKLQGELPELPPTGPSFTFKAMPRVDLQPGFDGPVLLARQQTTIDLKHCEVGQATVQLTPSAADPWAEIEIEQTLMGFLLVSDNTMLPGKIVAEVDPEAFLPFYFKMTDFSTGE